MSTAAGPSSRRGSSARPATWRAATSSCSPAWSPPTSRWWASSPRRSSAFRDEYPDLVPESLVPQATQLAGSTVCCSTSSSPGQTAAGRIGPEAFTDEPRRVLVHGHCHQKALASLEPTPRLLSLPAELYGRGDSRAAAAAWPARSATSGSTTTSRCRSASWCSFPRCGPPRPMRSSPPPARAAAIRSPTAPAGGRCIRPRFSTRCSRAGPALQPAEETSLRFRASCFGVTLG